MRGRVLAAIAVTLATVAACGVVVDVEGPPPDDEPDAATTETGTPDVDEADAVGNDAAKEGSADGGRTFDCTPVVGASFDSGAECSNALNMSCPTAAISIDAGASILNGAPCDASVRTCGCIFGSAGDWVIEGRSCQCVAR
ncbi:MAG: hypothetical protein JST00_32480 [Deltaproteobacteria bacterium]|nr:hypothetical protein [Deltaproteobacteria bacterium]